MPAGHGLDHGMSEQAALVERRVGHQGDALVRAVGQEAVLDAATGQAVDDLVGGHASGDSGT
ncbi:MAG TPA: hypothetical protein VGR26_16455 [Acidimicrobiales bacterium]|nr:hypothetical protein [Acidimicrobiales bacterium]